MHGLLCEAYAIISFRREHSTDISLFVIFVNYARVRCDEHKIHNAIYVFCGTRASVAKTLSSIEFEVDLFSKHY